MKPYYQDDFCTYQAGTAEIFPQLEPVDLVTDPPYGVNGAKGLNAFKKSVPMDQSFPDTPEY